MKGFIRVNCTASANLSSFTMTIYRYVLGHEAMKRMLSSKILLIGLKGLGIEVGKLA